MNKQLFSRSNVNSSIVSKPLRRKFLPILLSLTLLFTTVPLNSYAAISNPPLGIIS